LLTAAEASHSFKRQKDVRCIPTQIQTSYLLVKMYEQDREQLELSLIFNSLQITGGDAPCMLMAADVTEFYSAFRIYKFVYESTQRLFDLLQEGPNRLCDVS
jgi:hypothetical protein